MESEEPLSEELRIARAVADAHVGEITFDWWGAAAESESRHGAAAGAIVAEAVEVAMEAESAAAAAALAERAVEVTHAAQLVAEAADAARGARRSAAALSAQGVAHAAEQAARLVRAQADASAAQLQDAAAVVARDRAMAVASGTLPDEPRQVSILASQVRVIAETNAQATRQTAAILANAVSAAATTVFLASDVAEHRIQNDVSAAMWAVEHQAHMTAGQIARTTTAHAAGVALVAREAAAAASCRLEVIQQQTDIRRSAQARVSAAAPRGHGD